MKLFMSMIAVLLVMIMPILGYAQGLAPLPEIDLFAKLAELLMSWGSLGSLAKGSIVILILVQIAKQMTDFKYKRLLVALFSVAYGVMQMMISEVSLSSAMIAVLISGGGAMVIYSAAQPFLKSIPFFDFLKLGK